MWIFIGVSSIFGVQWLQLMHSLLRSGVKYQVVTVRRLKKGMKHVLKIFSSTIFGGLTHKGDNTKYKGVSKSSLQIALCLKLRRLVIKDRIINKHSWQYEMGDMWLVLYPVPRKKNCGTGYSVSISHRNFHEIAGFSIHIYCWNVGNH